MNKLRAKNIYLLYLLMVLLSMGLIHGYRLLPEKTLTLAPQSPFGIYTNGDQENGGNSTAEFINESLGQWRCTLREGVKPPNYPSCRIGISFSKDPDDWTQGLDFSEFDELRIQLDYQGPAKFFRAHFRNYSEELSRPDDYNSAKFVNLIIRDPAMDSDYSFALTEFKLADWWIQHYSVPNLFAKASLERVTSFELDFAEPVPYGEHQITLKSIALIGKYVSAEHWYLTILACWMLTFAVIGIVRLRQLSLVSSRQARHIQEMQKYAKELKQQSINYKNLSCYDPLTSAMNRQGLQEIIDSAFDWRREGNTIALLVIDIDHFKKINDSKGHEAGDLVLKAIGKMLVEGTRSVDTLARWGGEEFVLLCPHTPREHAMMLAEKIRVNISHLQVAESGIKNITASLGVTIIGIDEDFESAFKRADKALYDAKNNGRNCWVFA